MNDYRDNQRKFEEEYELIIEIYINNGITNNFALKISCNSPLLLLDFQCKLELLFRLCEPNLLSNSR